MKALSKLQDISKTLSAAGIESTDKEAGIILRNTLNISLIDIYRNNPELTEEQITGLDEIVRRRISREPLQYILGQTEFMGLRILVGKGVLIPRPETELMAEQAIKRVKSYELRGKSEGQNSTLNPSPLTRHPSLIILDLCTGSGCLALALAREFPAAQVYGTDISETALSYARRNAELNNIGNVSFVCGNLFEPFCHPELVSGSKNKEMLKRVQHDSHEVISEQCRFDLIISNPPYIKTADIKTLQPEIKDWEPISALDGGADGLDYFRAIIPGARQFLKHNGILMLELGAGCAKEAARVAEEAGYKDIETLQDYAGIERIISVKQ
ncbi:MAG: peptide chain release factor N(5)-glutamine methyltransferase [Nitrospirae bacterium]|nr:peptide chain release factor N(5)-glutamine methyltransferase [Nitrospirota bacterium]